MKSRLVIASLLIVALFAGAPAFAQSEGGQPGLEHNLMISAGLFAETGTNASDEFPGAAIRISYGLDSPLAGNWSLMPGIGTGILYGDIVHFGWIGGDPDAMIEGDVFCLARYHRRFERFDAVFGLGPQVSYLLVPDRYYYDANPKHPINNKEKFYRWGISLMPNVVFQTGRHFQWGFEGSIGLHNRMIQYPNMRTGKIHLHYLVFTCGWRF